MARFAQDPMNPTTQVFCAFLEYLARHTPAPATIRNKVSHVRVFLRLAGYTTALLDHIRVKMALDAFERDKTYVPRVKDPHQETVPTQPKEDVRHLGSLERLLRDRDKEARGMEIEGVPNIYRHPNWSHNKGASGHHAYLTVEP